MIEPTWKGIVIESHHCYKVVYYDINYVVVTNLHALNVIIFLQLKLTLTLNFSFHLEIYSQPVHGRLIQIMTFSVSSEFPQPELIQDSPSEIALQLWGSSIASKQGEETALGMFQAGT